MNSRRGFVEVLLLIGIVLAIVAILGVTYLGSLTDPGKVDLTPTPTVSSMDEAEVTITEAPTPTVADTDLQETDALLDSVSTDDFSDADLNDASLGL